MLLQHKGAFQELFESAQDLQTVPTNLFSRRLYGACMSGVRLEDRATLGARLGLACPGLPGIVWKAALSAEKGL